MAAKNGGAKLVYDLDVSCGQGTFPSAISELFCEREIMPATLLALIFRCPNVWLLSRCRAGVVALVREHQRLDRLALRRLLCTRGHQFRERHRVTIVSAMMLNTFRFSLSDPCPPTPSPSPQHPPPPPTSTAIKENRQQKGRCSRDWPKISCREVGPSSPPCN